MLEANTLCGAYHSKPEFFVQLYRADVTAIPDNRHHLLITQISATLDQFDHQLKSDALARIRWINID